VRRGAHRTTLRWQKDTGKEETEMPAIATLEELKAIDAGLKQLQEAFPEAYEEMAKFFRTNRKIGYKNIIKMMIGEATPEKLKGMG
jgi:hypothetical protein